MPTSVQKIMFERPVLCQIVPVIVFLFPPRMTELAHNSGGDRLSIQRGDPKPFVRGGFGLEFAVPVMILRQLLRVVRRER
jgi:hypothetical protein